MMENRDTQKKTIIIPWKHVGPQGASHPIWGFVSIQINRRYSQPTNTKYLRLRKMIVANRAIERDNKTVLSIQTKKGSLNSRKYCCFVVYLAKFLGSFTQRNQDMKVKGRETSHWQAQALKDLETGALWHAGRVCWLKEPWHRKGEMKGRQNSMPWRHWREGRMITLPAMVTTIPAGRLWFHQSTLGWWEDLDVFLSFLRMSVIQSHHGLWNWWVLLASNAQSRAINRQSQVHLD